ncbi:MAG: leucine-rich repeat domain-containing protein [Candidatus Lokiarchaeota archaeon]|nr:leucine-rich repeat domain-containing protein [Candidatus Lokiarchaeota archaeon]
MNLSPKMIYKQFERNEINKFIACDHLISFLENSENENIRGEAIQILDKLGIYDIKLFDILENILISDSNAKIRNIAIKFINKRFLTKAITPLKWAVNHENDYECLITIIKSLEKIDSEQSKLILFNQIKKIIKVKYLNKEKRIENKKYKKVIKKLLKTKKYETFSIRQLSRILINYLTIANLSKQHPNVYYIINPQNGLIKELDLSDFLEYEVKGTPFGWKNNIKSISSIIGLNNLQNLKKIDLSNNQIECVKELVNLGNLTHLTLTNNKISELENLEYIKKLPNLEYLDLRHNDIVKKIHSNEFNSRLRVLLKDSYIKIK